MEFYTVQPLKSKYWNLVCLKLLYDVLIPVQLDGFNAKVRY